MSAVVTSLYGLALGTENIIAVEAGEEPVMAGDEPVILSGSTFEGDLALDENGALLWTDGPEQATQEATCRLQFFLGEYFLDTHQGLPYRRDVLIKDPNRDVVRNMFERAILSVPGLIAPVVGYSLDTATRKLTVPWEARWIDGQPVAPVKPLEVLI